MAISAEDKAEIAEMMKAAFTGADIPGIVAKTVDGAIKGLDLAKQITGGIEAANKQAADAAKAAGDAAKGATGDDKKSGIENDPAFVALQRKLAANETKLADANTSREKADLQAKQSALLNSVRAKLTSHGVPADRLDHAVAYLHNMQGRAVYDDTGAMGIKFARTASTGNYEDILALDAGVKEWLGTDDGKAFLPPVGNRGTGDGAGGGAGHKSAQTGGKLDIDKAVTALFGASRQVDH